LRGRANASERLVVSYFPGDYEFRSEFVTEPFGRLDWVAATRCDVEFNALRNPKIIFWIKDNTHPKLLLADHGHRFAPFSGRIIDTTMAESWQYDHSAKVALRDSPQLVASHASNISTKSVISQRRDVTPAAIAGVTFKVWCTRKKL